jgi:hypothetical protein
MKEYEKLALEAEIEFTGLGMDDYSFDFVQGYKEGFLKARWMASNITIIGNALNRDYKLEAIVSLGEKEV